MSKKASPGVSTLSMLLGAVWPRRAVVVEADPSGGVAASRYGLGVEPGLVSLVATARRGLSEETLAEHCQAVSPQLSVVCAPVSGSQTGSALAHGGERLGDGLSGLVDVDVIVDTGRWWPGSPATGLVRSADVWLWVCRPRPDEVFALLEPEVQRPERPGGVLLVTLGSSPWSPTEVASMVGLELFGSVLEDSRAARMLTGGAGSERALRTSMFWRSGQRLVVDLAARLDIHDVSPSDAEARL